MATISQAQRLRELLENAIVEGHYAPGDRLDPEALALEYACSRTPIREALQQLVSSGMVRIQPKRGTFVAHWSISELVERFEVMAELEGMCARLAARRITPQELADLRAAQEACATLASQGDMKSYHDQNSLFHRLIYRASHNAFLESEATKLNIMLKPYRRMQVQVSHRVSLSLAEHQEVVDAIADGDGERAAGAIKTHVVVQGDRFNDLVAALRVLDQQAGLPG